MSALRKNANNEEKGNGYADALSVPHYETLRLALFLRGLFRALGGGAGRGLAAPRLGVCVLDAAFLLLLNTLRLGFYLAP